MDIGLAIILGSSMVFAGLFSHGLMLVIHDNKRSRRHTAQG